MSSLRTTFALFESLNGFSGNLQTHMQCKVMRNHNDYFYRFNTTHLTKGLSKQCRFCLFDLILYVPSTIFQLCGDGSSWVEPVLS